MRHRHVAPDRMVRGDTYNEQVLAACQLYEQECEERGHALHATRRADIEAIRDTAGRIQVPPLLDIRLKEQLAGMRTARTWCFGRRKYSRLRHLVSSVVQYQTGEQRAQRLQSTIDGQAEEIRELRAQREQDIQALMAQHAQQIQHLIEQLHACRTEIGLLKACLFQSTMLAHPEGTFTPESRSGAATPVSVRSVPSVTSVDTLMAADPLLHDDANPWQSEPAAPIKSERLLEQKPGEPGHQESHESESYDGEEPQYAAISVSVQ